MTSGNDDGYTFTEVLAALAILSFSGLLLWSGLNLGIRSIGKINGRNKETGEIILLEYYFRLEIGNRGAAYWEKEFSETYGGLYEKDDLLMLEEEGRVYAFPHLHLLEMESTDRGVNASITTDRGKVVQIRAHYGSFPLTGGADEE